MAKQLSPFKIQGTIGNITYYKSGNEYYARQKASSSKSRVMKDPSFQGFRNQMAEFGRVARANKLLRTTFRNYLGPFTGVKLLTRLTQLMSQILQSDETTDRGNRTVMNGSLDYLKDFEFNQLNSIRDSLGYLLKTGIDRNSGKCWMDIPQLNPLNLKKVPPRATHFKVSLAAASLDFDANSSFLEEDASGILPLKAVVAPMKLFTRLKPAANNVIILVIAIDFFAEAGEKMNPAAAGKYNAVGIVEISTP
jgi:hypothetical protein